MEPIAPSPHLAPHLAPPTSASSFAIPAPPPPTNAAFFVGAPPPLRAGQLTLAWGRFLLLTWLFVVASFIAIWVSSRNTGLSTWWLGPETAPRFIVINLLPFIVPAVMCLLCQLAVRGLPWFGMGAALVTAAIAAGDISREPGYAVAEFTIAGGALLASLACFAGVLRNKSVEAGSDLVESN